MANERPEDEVVLLDGETSHHNRWWIAAPVDRDCYELRIIRYSMLNEKVVRMYYLSPPDAENNYGWVEFNEMEKFPATYMFPGEVLHMFLETGLFIDRESIVESLRVIASTIFDQVAQERSEDGGADSGSLVQDSEQS